MLCDESNLSPDHAFECMKLVLTELKRRFPWITEAIRYTDQVAYYSGKDMLCLIKKYNNDQVLLEEDKRLVICIRTGNEPGHGKDAADRETNVTKCTVINARNSGLDLNCAEDVITQCEKNNLPGRIYILMNLKDNNSNTKSPKVTKFQSTKQHTWIYCSELSGGVQVYEHYGIGKGIHLQEKDLIGANSIYDVESASTSELNGVLTCTTVKQRRKIDKAKAEKKKARKEEELRKQRVKEENQRKANENFGLKSKKKKKKSLYNEQVVNSASKQPPPKLYDLFNQEICSSHVHVKEGDPFPPISSGYLKVTLIDKPEEGFLNDDGTVANIDLLKCKEIFGSCLNEGDRLVALRKIQQNVDDNIQDNIPVLEHLPVNILQDQSYPICAIFKRAPPPILSQGFARPSNAKIVTTPPTDVHKRYLLELFRLRVWLRAEQMQKKMKIDFPHPRDHLTVDQILNQIKAFVKKKKKGEIEAHANNNNHAYHDDHHNNNDHDEC